MGYSRVSYDASEGTGATMERAGETWSDGSDAALVFDRWMKIIASRLRAERGATINQFWALLVASERPGMPIATAASTLELNYTTIAECMGQLALAGALEKTEFEDDSRCALITMTRAGEHLMDTLDRCLMTVAKDALAPLEGERRVQGLRLFFEVCVRLDKKRMAGNLVRGDSVFIITCQQIAVEFGHLCRQYRLNEIQGHTLLAVGRGECISMKALRETLCLDAPALSRAVSRLVERGFAKRVKGASRRETNVVLTASGLQCASSLAEETDSMLARLFADDYGSAVFRQTVSALRASLEEYTRRP